ncbi:Hypothetical predicted protein, partial [Paramuricea clavata]
VAYEVRKFLREKCPGCKVNHPSRSRHECLTLPVEGWILHGRSIEAVMRVIERGILRKQFIEAIRALKLEYYERKRNIMRT